MSKVLKPLARASARFVVLPAYGLYRLFSMRDNDRRTFASFSQWFSLIPGQIGEYLRLEFYRLTLKRCADSCCISFGTIFSTSDVELHENTYIGAYCVIGRARIGKNSLVASRVSTISGIHQHAIDRVDVPIREQRGSFEEVHIGEDCWIGEGAVVGASIGAHSIVGAGCVVVREVEPYAVMSGNPATLIKSRKTQL